ncbi:hypothetical protein COO60DRAFT_1529762 [Scenedesmus sp. NREL 46B-D3]|nr:hypothetical protein COO60DRAFT_1529762 [Scenedesmus sp. NREL 46B-D3]
MFHWRRWFCDGRATGWAQQVWLTIWLLGARVLPVTRGVALLLVALCCWRSSCTAIHCACMHSVTAVWMARVE